MTRAGVAEWNLLLDARLPRGARAASGASVLKARRASRCAAGARRWAGERDETEGVQPAERKRERAIMDVGPTRCTW